MGEALTQAAVARQLHRSPRTIRRWTDAGRLPVWFYDDNGRPVYHSTVIEAHARRVGELRAETLEAGRGGVSDAPA